MLTLYVLIVCAAVLCTVGLVIFAKNWLNARQKCYLDICQFFIDAARQISLEPDASVIRVQEILEHFRNLCYKYNFSAEQFGTSNQEMADILNRAQQIERLNWPAASDDDYAAKNYDEYH
jgi:hypothetical protein